MRTRPPAASILLSKKWPNLLPIAIPIHERTNVIRPIIITAAIIEFVISESVKPIASASILVATDSANKTKILEGSKLSLFGFILKDS